MTIDNTTNNDNTTTINDNDGNNNNNDVNKEHSTIRNLNAMPRGDANCSEQDENPRSQKSPAPHKPAFSMA